MKASYKIVFYKPSTVRTPNREVIEVVTFECNDPLAACEGYINKIMSKNSAYVKAQVFPAETAPIMEAHVKVPVEKSDLFAGYAKPAARTACGSRCKTSCGTGRVIQGFSCPASTWLDRVELLDCGCMKVYFIGSKSVCYTADDIQAEYAAFKAWVDMGNSAGHFYNINVKGKLDTVDA